jgi:hypothetical protein
MKALLFVLLLSSSYTLSAKDWKLKGKSMLEFSIFKIDIYEISYYKSADSTMLVLDYKKDVAKKYSIEGWKKGLEKILAEKKIPWKRVKWLIDNSVDLDSGDKLKIIVKKDLVSLFKNDRLISQINDQLIAELVFEPWIGKYPVDKKVKKELTKAES